MSEVSSSHAEATEAPPPDSQEIAEVQDETGEQSLESTDPLHGAEDPRSFRLERSDEYIEPMSRVHTVEQFRDPNEFVDRINPDLETDEAYQVNCADCARCCEAAWRGQEQEAAGRAWQVGENGGLEARGEASETTEEWAHEKFETTDAANLRSVLEQGGHGSSAIVHSTWEGPDPGGHAYNVMNRNGEIMIVDAQEGEVYEYADQDIYPEMERQSGVVHRTMAWDAKGRRIL